MAVKSKNPKIAIKNPDLRQYISGQFKVPQMTDSGSGIAAGRICEYTSGQIKSGTEQNSLVLGMTRSALGVSGVGDVEFGFVPCLAGSPVAVGDRIAPRASGYIGKAQTAQATLLNAVAGGNFGNQPANDGVEITSSSAADTTQTATLYGVRNGALTTLVTDVVTLVGTSIASSAYTDWYYILGIRLSASCAGTVTIREASADATITTISTGTLTAGISTSASSNGYGLPLRHVASGASTAYVGALGKGLDGSTINIVAALNGATEEDHGTTPFGSVTEFYIGAAASGVNVTFKTNEASDASYYCGVALQTTTVPGVPVDCWLKPYWM